jgi:hypothetical protein
MATAFEAPKEREPEAPQETLLTILLHPAPMNTLFTSLCMVSYRRDDGRRRKVLYRGDENGYCLLKKKKMKQAEMWALFLTFASWPI